MVSDLTALTFEPTPNGIKVIPKDKVCEQLHRSTDKGDGVIMAWWNGPKLPSHYAQWQEEHGFNKRGATPAVNYGPRRRHG